MSRFESQGTPSLEHSSISALYNVVCVSSVIIMVQVNEETVSRRRRMNCLHLRRTSAANLDPMLSGTDMVYSRNWVGMFFMAIQWLQAVVICSTVLSESNG
jgi:hypothetical protein